jgi:hypothetical protein
MRTTLSYSLNSGADFRMKSLKLCGVKLKNYRIVTRGCSEVNPSLILICRVVHCPASEATLVVCSSIIDCHATFLEGT